MNAALVGSDRRYLRLKDYLIACTGLAYYRDRDEDLSRRIGQRMQRLGIACYGEYLESLCAGPDGLVELDLLIADLTIGETYFFRHSEQFDALRSRALPDILQRNQHGRTLRVWSAGCANGAEAYSLSILAHETAPGWTSSILGTDVNRRSLSQARQGRYENWALRGISSEARDRYLRRDGDGWTIHERYRQGVVFQYHNLVRGVLPSRLDNLFAFDLILCRNVMIYFDRATVAALVANLWECLADGGWLVVGHADIDLEAFQAFEPVHGGGVTLFRKPGSRAEAQPTVATFEPKAELECGWPQNQRDFLPSAGSLAPSLAQPNQPAKPRTAVDELRDLADRGVWADAVRRCSALLEAAPLDAELHFYHGLILEQMGRLREAEKSLRRSVYLDRRSVLGHYHLGLLLQGAAAAPEGARRCFDNVLALLETLDEGFRFELGDGITVAGLRELTKAHLELLRA